MMELFTCFAHLQKIRSIFSPIYLIKWWVVMSYVMSFKSNWVFYIVFYRLLGISFRMERLLASGDCRRLCSLISHQCRIRISKVFTSSSKNTFSSEAPKKVDLSSNPKSADSTKAGPSATQELAKVLLDPPTSCCMSGCSNCVWIVYAENLAKLTKDGGEQARKLIEKNVTDPSLKAFLLTELKMRQ